ncbi:MAG: 23S rRNA (pseudouridine(1915)-N(3))-methyltransferase RlmH [Deltaproteobacteria bacterium]|nr:23S rRNA (pseudouridine(1915)-N(3))-methyltransferase RlmH [Deltaproteobacteria bacterium]
MILVTAFGKTPNELRDRYIKRIKTMMPFEWNEIPLKKCPDQRPSQLLPEEIKFLKNASPFFLLDADGKSFDSNQFYRWCFQSSERHLVIGPAVGFHQDFYKAALGKISLSPLTLTHGLAHLVLAESIYRSVCMLKNHPFVK